MNAECAGKTEIPWERVPYLSALEVCSRQGAIQIHVYLYGTYIYRSTTGLSFIHVCLIFHQKQTGVTCIFVIFTALHEMQTRSSDENSVCPSVRLSVCHTRDPWQNGRKIGPDFYTTQKNI